MSDAPFASDEAIYAFRRNLVVAASAGTGKTFRLVTLYALLALGLTSKGQADDETPTPAVSPRAIVATTFSRAAAVEIRERVQKLLKTIVSGDQSPEMQPYRAVLEARAQRLGLGDLSGRELRGRAERALGELPLAIIDTLHGLAGQILRACAIELGMPPSFSLLEEEDAHSDAARAIDQALVSAIGRNESAGRDLLDAGGGLAPTRSNLIGLLDRVTEEGVRVRDLAVHDPAADRDDLLRDLERIARALVDEAASRLADGARAVLRALPSWRDGSASEADIRAVLELLFAVRISSKRTAAVQAFFELRSQIEGETNGKKASALAAFLAMAPALGERTRAAQRLVDGAAEALLESRLKSARLSFGDLLRLARDMLRDRPDFAARIRKRFEVLLVDEFQDTSRVQRDLVYLLRERPERASARPLGAVPTAADLEPSGLLIVGDRKQSIYGFRGADVTVFTQVSIELAGDQARTGLGLPAAGQADAYADFVALANNRRSARSILSFVNAFAQRDFSPGAARPFDLAYAQAEWLEPPPGAPEGEPVTIVTDDGTAPEGTDPVVTNASGALREALLAAALIDRIVRRQDTDRSFKDFAVLVRRRSTLPLLEFALSRLEIPFATAGRALFHTQEVRDLAAVLNLVLDPQDRQAMATVLRGPAVGLADTSLALLCEPGRGLSSWSEWFVGAGGLAARLAPDERSRLARFTERLTELRRLSLGLGPADALRCAVEKLDLDYVMAALPRGAQRLGNVTRLIALAAGRGGSLSTFVRWLDKNIAEQTDEDEAAVVSPLDDAVTLMTIHASKGLEFRCVVLVDLGAGVQAQVAPVAIWPGSGVRPARLVVRHRRTDGARLFTPEAAAFRSEGQAREHAERKRLTYVALTRARRELYLVGSRKGKKGSAAMATLQGLIDDEAALRGAAARIVTARELLGPPGSPRTSADASPSPNASPFGTDSCRAGDAGLHLAAAPFEPSSREPSSRELSVRTLSVTTTALAVFAQCARRYRLVHELGVDEPPYRADRRPIVSDRVNDPRALGTAVHAVLERWPIEVWGERIDPAAIVTELVQAGFDATSEATVAAAQGVARFLSSRFAASVRGDAAWVGREEPFVLSLEMPQGTLHLRGSMDLLVARHDGTGHVLDYKLADGTSAAPHAFQLTAYALAASRRLGLTQVRAAVAYLGASFEEPVYLSDRTSDEPQGFEAELARCFAGLCEARRKGQFLPNERRRCEALRCGFIEHCHAEHAWAAGSR